MFLVLATYLTLYKLNLLLFRGKEMLERRVGRNIMGCDSYRGEQLGMLAIHLLLFTFTVEKLSGVRGQPNSK